MHTSEWLLSSIPLDLKPHHHNHGYKTLCWTTPNTQGPRGRSSALATGLWKINQMTGMNKSNTRLSDPSSALSALGDNHVLKVTDFPKESGPGGFCSSQPSARDLLDTCSGDSLRRTPPCTVIALGAQWGEWSKFWDTQRDTGSWSTKKRAWNASQRKTQLTWVGRKFNTASPGDRLWVLMDRSQFFYVSCFLLSEACHPPPKCRCGPRIRGGTPFKCVLLVSTLDTF